MRPSPERRLSRPAGEGGGRRAGRAGVRAPGGGRHAGRAQHAVVQHRSGAVLAAAAGSQPDTGAVHRAVRAAAAGLHPAAAWARQAGLRAPRRAHLRPGALWQRAGGLRGDPQRGHEHRHQHLHLLLGAQRPAHRLLLHAGHYAPGHLQQLAGG